MKAVAVLLLSATVGAHANDSDRFLDNLVEAATSSTDVRPEILAPALTPEQIVVFRVVKNCDFAASFASTNEHVRWTWNCGDGSQGSHSMDVYVSERVVTGVSFDGRKVWPVLEPDNG